jgi:hypothetical protein
MVLTFNLGVSFWVGVSDAVDFVCEVVDIVGVTTEFCTSGAVGAVTVDVAVGDTGVAVVGFTGLTGDTGLVTFVGLVTDFTQLLDVVTQGCHTGCPYGFGHVEERVWIMFPV